MGLDMYLTRKYYVKNWEHNPPKDRWDITVKRGGKEFPIQNIKYIEEEAMYWRKANAIHKWFVDNVQDGEDDCKEYYVSREQLEELLSAVKRVIRASKLIPGEVRAYSTIEDGKLVDKMEEGKIIKNPTIAKRLLPVAAGFFFGGTDYDDEYYQDLVDTKEALERVLKTKDGEFYYQSSW